LYFSAKLPAFSYLSSAEQQTVSEAVLMQQQEEAGNMTLGCEQLHASAGLGAQQDEASFVSANLACPSKNLVFSSMKCVIQLEPMPIINEEAVSATANLILTIPEINMNPSGLIKGDDVRNAIIGPQGRVVVSIETITAMVPQAQKGVNAPKATLPVIDTPAFFISTFLSFPGLHTLSQLQL
jgi:hypothetical protein